MAAWIMGWRRLRCGRLRLLRTVDHRSFCSPHGLEIRELRGGCKWQRMRKALIMRLWPLGWWLDTCGPPVFGDDAHLSEDAQKRAIQRLAEEHGVKVEWYVDSGISGMVLDRPALQRLLVDAESGTSGLIRVFVHSPSRLSRKRVDLQTVLVRLEAAGVELVYVNQSG